MRKLIQISALGLAAAGTAQASTGTITFNGQLTATTCSASVNGTGPSATVTLPTISISELDAAGKSAGLTRFQINLTGCTGTMKSVAAFFDETPGSVDAGGRLINSGTAENVQIELRHAAAGADAIIEVGRESQLTHTSAWYPFPTTGSQALHYAAQYYATATSTAGTVVSKANYTLMYK